MRAVKRPRGVPPTLRSTGPGGIKAARNEIDRDADPLAALSFPQHWNAADVRGALYATHGKVCAYCGCKLPGNDRGDVDHFRPKGNLREDPNHGGYWWLAYTFENYLLSCSPCNSNCKSDRFPLASGAVRILYSTRARLLCEARQLIDPSRDLVEKWLRVDWEKDLCPLRAANSVSRRNRTRVNKTLEFFRINTDPRLVGERIEIRDSVIADLDQGRVDLARMKAICYRPQSIVDRQILADLHHPSPTASEELQWLLSDLLADLDLAIQILIQGPSEIAAKRKEELLWSLAYLWRYPRSGTQAQMRAMLTSSGVSDAVTPYRSRL